MSSLEATACPEFFIAGGGALARRPRAGMGSLGRGSTPFPPAREFEERCKLHQRPRPPKGFPLFSALRVASPGIIILLTVDYHAAIGGKTPVPPPPPP